MEKDEADEVQELLGYPEDSAGGIMTTEYIALAGPPDRREAIDRLRELEPDAETIYYVYVTDDDGRLVGVLSLRDLIVAKPDTPISDVMINEPITVSVPTTRTTSPASSRATTCSPCRSSTTTAILEGIVTVDDALDAVLPTAWQKRLPHVLAVAAMVDPRLTR